MKNIFLIIFITLSFSQVNHPYPPLDLVSIPTSGTLPKGSFTIETLLTKNGGMVPKLLVGLNDNFSIEYTVRDHFCSRGLHDLAARLNSTSCSKSRLQSIINRPLF